MRIERCCSKVKLPGGERRWRRMARHAKFRGTLRIRPFTTRSALTDTAWELGEFHPVKGIRVRIDHDHGPIHPGVEYSALATFGHELGHNILFIRGKPYGSNFTTTEAQNRDPIERACDRYSRLLVALTDKT